MNSQDILRHAREADAQADAWENGPQRELAMLRRRDAQLLREMLRKRLTVVNGSKEAA